MKKLINKYSITIGLFLVVMIFIGDQCWIKRVRRAREIKELEEQRDSYREGIRRSAQEIEVLSNPDSLAQFAREEYLMHTDKEVIYLVEEPK